MDTDMENTSSADSGGGKAAPIGGILHTSDRGELIERIKRGGNPTWVPNPAVRCDRVSSCMQQTHRRHWIRTAGFDSSMLGITLPNSGNDLDVSGFVKLHIPLYRFRVSL